MIVILGVIFVVVYIIIRLNSTSIKGTIGELKTNANLSFLGSEYIFLNDVMIRNSNGTTSQIDHIVLSEYGIFVIETKNYKGWIFGNEKSEKWTQVIYKEKHTFINPVKQNLGHVYALKGLLAEFPNIKYYPIVVFAGSATLKDIQSSVPVIYESSLNQTIKMQSSVKCLSNDEILKIKNILETSAITDKDSKREDIQNIYHNVNERKEKINNRICPKCNGKLIIRNGRNGLFYGCSNYPSCRFTMNY